jgi:hypothetical protein
MVMNGDQLRIRKEVDVAYLKVLSWHSFGDHGKL